MSRKRVMIRSAIGVVLLIVAVILPHIVNELKLRAMPEQKELVVAIDKGVLTRRWRHTDRRICNTITFGFLDGSIAKFKVEPKKIYDTIHVGDVGTLAYKGALDSANVFDRLFVSFEKDTELLTPYTNLTAKSPTNVRMWYAEGDIDRSGHYEKCINIIKRINTHSPHSME